MDTVTTLNERIQAFPDGKGHQETLDLEDGDNFSNPVMNDDSNEEQSAYGLKAPCRIFFVMKQMEEVKKERFEVNMGYPILRVMKRFSDKIQEKLENLEFRSQNMILSGEEYAGSIEKGLIDVSLKYKDNETIISHQYDTVDSLISSKTDEVDHTPSCNTLCLDEPVSNYNGTNISLSIQHVDTPMFFDSEIYHQAVLPNTGTIDFLKNEVTYTTSNILDFSSY